MTQRAHIATEIPAIVKRAMLETIENIGQLSAHDIKELNRAVKLGYLVKGLGGSFPKLKTVYAIPSYDFVGERNRYVNHMMALAYLDEQAAQHRNIGGR